MASLLRPHALQQAMHLDQQHSMQHAAAHLRSAPSPVTLSTQQQQLDHQQAYELEHLHHNQQDQQHWHCCHHQPQQQQQDPCAVHTWRYAHLSAPFQSHARDLPGSIQGLYMHPTAGKSPTDSLAVLAAAARDIQADLSVYHSKPDDSPSEGDPLSEGGYDSISDNDTELGSDFYSDPGNGDDPDADNVDDRAGVDNGDKGNADNGTADDEVPSDTTDDELDYDTEGTSDYDDAHDGYGTTEEEEENNSIPPADLEAILAENARLWGHLQAGTAA